VNDSPLEKKPQAPTPALRKPTAETEVRASDADRDRVADILRDALADGRLDAHEHSERLDAVYAAKTMGELEPLTRDLPAVTGHSAERPRPAREPVREASAYDGVPSTDNAVAIFGGATRSGRWRVAAKTNAFALFGGIEIDLTQATFEHREIVINATALFGGIEVRVPENVTLRGHGAGVFGGFEVRPHDADPDAPVVLVRGAAIFGGVDAKPKRGKRLKNLRKGDGR
jgi:uncharacterized protein DUF1707/cell wall-active antibiotic response 4TMS protein YvqF